MEIAVIHTNKLMKSSTIDAGLVKLDELPKPKRLQKEYPVRKEEKDVGSIQVRFKV